MPVVAHIMPVYDMIEMDAAATRSALLQGWVRKRPSEDWRIKPALVRGQPIMYVRNMGVQYALDDLSGHDDEDDRALGVTGAPADIILWQDSDVSCNPATLIWLADALWAMPEDVAILGCPLLIQSQGPSPQTNVEFLSETGKTEALRIDDRTVERVRSIGTGLIAVRAAAYRDVGYPWYKWQFADNPMEKPLGEDYGFCRDIQDKGWSVYAWMAPDASHNYRRAHVIGSVGAHSGRPQ